ncbi:hypothetical protein SAMN05443665_106827 [Actinomadura meyerae]|uniref:Uncharacterized protein n=1 Tax=Actinomadura meyerae TaxID=240840 RepID=A0A239P5X9_9ACTN|nr:hypothetical protein [Actinomadura meyerae]SNT62074.1 hypothetical protein SAMN05443665_106827 [Actinomadura meyerae]
MHGLELAFGIGLMLSLLISAFVASFLSGRAERRLEEERLAEARDTLAYTLVHYRRAELDYIRLRLESPGTQAAREAHSASFRDRTSVNIAYKGVRIAYTDPHIRLLAQRAFDLTGEIHYSKTLEEAREHALEAAKALIDFVTATGASVHSVSTGPGPRPLAPKKQLPQPDTAPEVNTAQKAPHTEQAPDTHP